jgi:hypothetical protein
MTAFIRTLTAATLCSFVFAAPAAAACQNGRCEAATAAAGQKPLKLKKFMRKPVASSATSTVKQKSGGDAKGAAGRRAKPRAAAPAAAPPTPELSTAAAQAFAAYELARVRVVTPEEAEHARVAADVAASSKVLAVDNVQIVRADELNDIDRKADSPFAISLDALSRDLAGSREQIIPAEPKAEAEAESWYQRILMVFRGAFAGVAALVRVLIA